MLTSIALVYVMEIIHIFQNLELTSLSKLEAQHNHIGTIDLHAFSGLTVLIILNLSYNHLDYILPATFEDTPQLRSLYLRGNKLKIYPGPILIIPALQV
jgi:Leucine-rich repeat (LRR) protein